MDSDSPFRTLLVHCMHCGRDVTLLYAPDDTKTPTTYAWICPYPDCRKDRMNTIDELVGDLLDEWTGHGSDPNDDERLLH